jgi:folate-binding protein YgfZ
MQILPFFAPISIRGADARSFLQGQLSNDLNMLTPEQALLASCNSAQGRVQAIMTLIEREDGLLAIAPKAITASLTARLGKYILRSKVVITDVSEQLQCVAATAESLHQFQLPVPVEVGAHAQSGQVSILRWWDTHPRFLTIQPKSEAVANSVDAVWLLDDIRAGIPHVLPQTYEAFVAQMLNLDALNGISFTKGCYTGQEIIARAHYRGTVKRRMFRLSANCAPPVPATRILTGDGIHAGDVVIATSTDDGCELLAVLSLNHVESAVHLEGNADMPLKKKSLPYAIPSLD